MLLHVNVFTTTQSDLLKKETAWRQVGIIQSKQNAAEMIKLSRAIMSVCNRGAKLGRNKAALYSCGVKSSPGWRMALVSVFSTSLCKQNETRCTAQGKLLQ
jgi:hypothetical protein